MLLNSENYFSFESDKEYFSVSQFHLFRECESKALAVINNVEAQDKKQAFLEGNLFENIVTGNSENFLKEHPELFSSRGSTAGQLKADYQKIVNSANRFLDQKFFTDIINKCEKQVILTGEIEGIKVKCMLDLFDKKTNSIYDIKCMKDFKDQWLQGNKAYAPWYYVYGYVLQLAVYREIVRQNFGEPQKIGLIAATKEEVPDIEAVSFSEELLDIELHNFKRNVKRYDNIKKGLEKPFNCGICNYCKSHKIIEAFEEVK